jgi:hypothetical protein
MRKLFFGLLVVAVLAAFGGLLAGSSEFRGAATQPDFGQPDHISDGVRTISLWSSERRKVEATVGVDVRSTEGRPTHYRSSIEIRCQVRGYNGAWQPHPCTANFGQRLIRDQSTVVESWAEVTSADDGRIVSDGEWQPVVCRGLYTTELLAYQIGVAGTVHTIEGNPGYFPSNGIWADC